jgi:hypothetical protein
MKWLSSLLDIEKQAAERKIQKLLRVIVGLVALLFLGPSLFLSSNRSRLNLAVGVVGFLVVLIEVIPPLVAYYQEKAARKRSKEKLHLALTQFEENFGAWKKRYQKGYQKEPIPLDVLIKAIEESLVSDYASADRARETPTENQSSEKKQ